MRRLNPAITDVLYRAGAFPVDDFDSDDGSMRLSTWVIITKSLPIILSISGNGRNCDRLVEELRRIATVSEYWMGALVQDGLVWTYQLGFLAGDTTARVFEREIVPRDPEEWNLVVAAHAFVHWFEPNPMYHGKPLSVDHLPVVTYDVYDDDDRPVRAEDDIAAAAAAQRAGMPLASFAFDFREDDELDELDDEDGDVEGGEDDLEDGDGMIPSTVDEMLERFADGDDGEDDLEEDDDGT